MLGLGFTQHTHQKETPLQRARYAEEPSAWPAPPTGEDSTSDWVNETGRKFQNLTQNGPGSSDVKHHGTS